MRETKLTTLANARVKADPAVARAVHNASLETGARFDLLVVDFAMPELSGSEVAEQVAAIDPALPVILITGFADSAKLDAIAKKIGYPDTWRDYGSLQVSAGKIFENVMAAIGAAWSAGMDWDVIRAGLASFVNDSDNAPGRFNVMSFKGATVIADYGHNPDAMRALVDAVNGIPAKRRSVVISGAGDRRDEDIREQTAILGEAFDDFILYQDACQRGREDGEVLGLLREGLSKAQRAQRVDEIRGEFVAIDTALERLQPGDLCLVLVDQVEEALAHLAKRCAESASAQ